MKHVLIFLLFVTPLFGQYPEKSLTIPDSVTYEFPIYIAKEPNDIRLYHVFINLLVKDWDSYAKECYDDSTEDYGVIWDFDGVQYQRVEEKWIHKEPNFHGFIEYLRRKK